jgi:hypothetical protein
VSLRKRYNALIQAELKGVDILDLTPRYHTDGALGILTKILTLCSRVYSEANCSLILMALRYTGAGSRAL